MQGLRFAAGSKSWNMVSGRKNFYLQLTAEKMRTFAVFIEKYLWSYA